MVTYGDGVSDVDIGKLLEFHKKSRSIGTLTGVHPSSRFGELLIKGRNVMEFNEKSPVSQGFINGGFFVFNKAFFRYLSESEDSLLEREPLQELSADGQLSVYRHNGFWQCMDTQREMDVLNQLWNKGKAPWKTWKD
jgi:glucose-1-phosphate cytidylyltransferase